MTYQYLRLASIKPTVEGFLLILRGNLIQSDAAQEKRDRKRGIPPNIYALGLMLEALNKIRSELHGVANSSDPEDLNALKKSINRHFNDIGPVTKTLKTIDAYLTSGKAPNYPTGGGIPTWK